MDGFSGFTFFVLALLIFTAVTAWKGVRIVPQGEEWVVERLGKYRNTLEPGLHIIVPYIDRVAYRVITKDIILDVAQQEVITKDNAVILVNAIAFIKVTDPVKAVYGVTDFAEAIRNLVQTTLRSIVGEMELDAALSSREKIKARLREMISDEAIDWGLTIKSVEIQDVKPSESMVKSMELQAAAERERKAVVTKAEGEKQAMILEAEGRLESAKRDAIAQVTLAESSSAAIQKVAQAVEHVAHWFALRSHDAVACAQGLPVAALDLPDLPVRILGSHGHRHLDLERRESIGRLPQ